MTLEAPVWLILLPFLGAFVYLIARGKSMQERAVTDMAARESATRSYIQGVARSTSTADELTKLASLHEQGVLTDQEFQSQKAALLG